MAQDTLFPELPTVKSDAPLSAKEKRRKYNQAYIEKNRERISQKNKEYHQKHRDRLLAAGRQRYHENIEVRRANSRRWHQENRDLALKKMREYGKKNNHKALGRARKKRYGITPEIFDAMFNAQNKCCAICGCSSTRAKNGWHLDHSHQTGKVRAILCNNCNCGLGYAKDSIETLQNMVEYLKYHERLGKNDTTPEQGNVGTCV